MQTRKRGGEKTILRQNKSKFSSKCDMRGVYQRRGMNNKNRRNKQTKPGKAQTNQVTLFSSSCFFVFLQLQHSKSRTFLLNQISPLQLRLFADQFLQNLCIGLCPALQTELADHEPIIVTFAVSCCMRRILWLTKCSREETSGFVCCCLFSAWSEVSSRNFTPCRLKQSE